MAEQRVPFDDRPALEELERLQRSIQEYRRKREQAEGEFEAFVGGFRPQEGQRSNSPARVAAATRTIHSAGREDGGRAAGRGNPSIHGFGNGGFDAFPLDGYATAAGPF